METTIKPKVFKNILVQRGCESILRECIETQSKVSYMFEEFKDMIRRLLNIEFGTCTEGVDYLLTEHENVSIVITFNVVIGVPESKYTRYTQAFPYML